MRQLRGAARRGTVGATRTACGVVITAKPAPFSRMMFSSPTCCAPCSTRWTKIIPRQRGAARARTGKLDGTALMALDAGDQCGRLALRGLELFERQLDPAANQFGVALRNAPDAPIASFYLGACYAAAGRDKEAVAAWERARAAQLQLPGLQVILANGWLRLGQPAQALEPLREALEREPQNDQIRKNLAVAQSQLGLHEQAYPTITPFLERNPSDVDALLVALQALYQVHVEGRTIGSAEQDKAQAAAYARAYGAVKGPQSALVEKWAEFLSR